MIGRVTLTIPCFCVNHAQVEACDLAGLERAVKHAMQIRDDHNAHHYNSSSCASMSSGIGITTARPGTAGSGQRRRTGVIASSSHGSNHNNIADGSIRRDGSPRSVMSLTRTVVVKGSDTAEVSRRNKQRPSTAGSATSHRRRGQIQQQGGRSKPTPTTRSGRGNGGGGGSWDNDDNNVVPRNIKNEWLILETYQQLKMDEKQSEENRRAQEGR